MENQLYRTIELYLRQQMPPDERRIFEEKIAADPQLADEVAFYEALLLHHDEKAKAKWRAQDESLLQPETQIRPVSRPHIRQPQWAIAATLALLLAATGVWYTFFYHPAPNLDIVFQENYEGYKYSNLLGNSYYSAEDSLWKSALGAYRSERYQDAIAAASQLNNSTKYAGETQLLMGAAYLEQGRTEEAVRSFEQVGEPPALRRKAQFFVAMAYLKAKNADQAKALLRAIAADSDNSYKEKAAAILEDL